MTNRKQLKEVYRKQKKIDHLFTGDHLQLNSSGNLLLSPCETSFKIINLNNCQIVDEIKSVELNVDEREESIITFDYEFKKNYLLIAYSSGLLRQWQIQINENFNANNDDNNDNQIKVEHILLRCWKSLHIGPIARICFDTSGTMVATGGSDGSIKLWNIVQNYCTHNLKEAKGVVQTITFAPDFSTDCYHLLAAGDYDYSIHVWNLIDSKHVIRLDGHQSKITEIQYTNDHKKFISSSRDKLLIIWNARTFQKERTMAVFESIETFLLIPSKKFNENIFTTKLLNKTNSPNLIVTAGETGLLKVWDYQNGNLVFSQDKSLLTVQKQKNVEETKNNNNDVGDVDDPESSKVECQYTQINQLVYNSNIEQILAISYDKDIVFHNIEDLIPKRQLTGSNDEILDLKFIGTEQSHIAVATNSPKIKIFSLKTFDCFILVGHSDIVLALDIFPNDPCLMVSSGKDNMIRVWRFSNDCQSAQCLFQGSGHTHSINSLKTSMLMTEEEEKTIGYFFLSGSEDTTLKCWKLPKNLNNNPDSEPISLRSKYTQSCHDKTINSIDVSPNNQLAVTGSQDKTAKLWQLPNLKLMGVFRGHRKGIWTVKFSPVDQILATGSSDCTIKIWSITTMNCLKTFQGHDSSVLNVLFIDEGMQFLTSSSDGNLKIWNLKSNECTATFDAHDGKVWAMDLSNDEQILVTGADDSIITIWNDETEQVREKETLKLEIMVQNEQTLQNLLQRKSWFKALKLAIKFNHPLRCLNILKEIILETSGQNNNNNDDNDDHWIDSIVEDLQSKLRQDQLLQLFEYSIHWNTNSKHWLIANIILRTVFEKIPPEELLQISQMKSNVEKLLPYCDRHQIRINRLKQYVTFADFVYEQMKLPDQNQK